METFGWWHIGMLRLKDVQMSYYKSSTAKRFWNFGAAFKLGRHEWFALRRLIINSRNSAFTGGFLNSFIKETSQKDGRTKNRIMKRPLHGTLRLRSPPTGKQIQNGRRRVKLQETQLPLDVAQSCFVLVFPLQLFLWWKFRNFLLRNKALVYLLYLLNHHNLRFDFCKSSNYKGVIPWKYQ